MVSDDAFLVDQEGHTPRDHPDALVSTACPQRTVGIAHQLERQLVAGGELLVRLQAVAADPDHHGAGIAEGFILIAEGTRLGGAAGRVVLGVKVQDDGQVDRDNRSGELAVHWRRQVDSCCIAHV